MEDAKKEIQKEVDMLARHCQKKLKGYNRKTKGMPLLCGVDAIEFYTNIGKAAGLAMALEFLGEKNSQGKVWKRVGVEMRWDKNNGQADIG